MSTTTTPFLSVRNLAKNFGAFRALHDIDLDIHRGEFVCFLGPSGCGKTTLLRAVAGLDLQDSGTIHMGGRDVSRASPSERDFGIVFQSYALFPNLTVADNVGYGLVNRRRTRDEIAKRVNELLTLVGLPEQGRKYPVQLSGGQQQRVALARALATSPELLLLDEPLSALDAKVRVSLREEIRSIQQKLGITTIFVTHDQEEALSISDRIAVMYGGKAEQVGTPFEIYNRPATKFVANFVGTLNVLQGTVSDVSTGKVRVGEGEVVLRNKLNGSKAGDSLTLALRPEAISLGRQPGREASLGGLISEVSFLGSVIRVKVGLGKDAVSLDTFNSPTSPPPTVGETAEISFSPDDVLVLHD